MLTPRNDYVGFRPLSLAPNPPFWDSANYSSPLPTGSLLGLFIGVPGGRGRGGSTCTNLFAHLPSVLSLKALYSPSCSLEQLLLQSPAPLDTNRSHTSSRQETLYFGIRTMSSSNYCCLTQFQTT